MTLAIFDLDNTLLGGDSDHAWGEFLIAQDLVDAETHKALNDRFYEDYQSGKLDIIAYQRFALSHLKGQSVEQARALQARFFETTAEPLMLDKAKELITKHREANDTLLVITATNRFVTSPIVEAFDIPHLIACEPEIVNNHYTGEIVGVPSYQEGKITRLNEWLNQQPQKMSLEGAYFYSDSRNDLPLLSAIDHPVAVDPDDTLLAHAKSAGWPVISLR